MMLSIVIPVCNEEKSINELFHRTSAALNTITNDWEVVCVDDGSDDNTLSLLVGFHRNDPRWKIVSFSRNFGHQRAVWAGLNYAQGDYIGIMDGDLQDDPLAFPIFFDRLSEDADIVYAIRSKRKGPILKKIAYYMFYRVVKNMLGVNIPVDSGDFCLLKRKVLTEILKMPEYSLFVRGIRSWVGFKQVGISVDRDRRTSGKAKYSLKQLLHLAYDGIFSFSDFPIKFLGRLGIVTIMLSILYSIYILFKRIVLNEVPEGFTTLIIVILFFGGVQLVSVRILGEYLFRVYNESRKRPLYIVRSTYGELGDAKA